ncbi:MAG: molybdopterin-dependent oxidoreductase [Actinobacteria bacterium]|nr:molybdopterin-dependent oxidoreductase [Actinomycetota bacterium]
MASPAESDMRPYGRRAFLGVVAVGLSSLAWGEAAWRGLSSLLDPVTGRLAGPLGALPSPAGGWRIYNVNPPMPSFDRATWRLRIEGLVERPVELSYDQLRGLPRAEQISDFHCVTGWSVESVRWAGVRFRDLVEVARPLPGAKAVAFVSAERPYVDTLTLEQALLPDAMLAYELDGEPLSRPHGAPARLVIPEMYGYKNVKWVERIVLGREAFDGYWEQRGYDRDAWVGRSNGYG